VALPRFKFGFGLELKTILGKLGMAQAFDPQTACFDRIATPPPPFWLASVFHRALVEVNEEGTEAVAMTEMEGAVLGRRPTQPFTMIVDRPFFFAICDSQSRSLLFMGAVNNPA